ncbi:MAG: redoxin domain-containing protein, partial [Bacteroidaceae bacterium]|nr:redoxin domain-containing protein [Bacteroidaceae bacterium]
MKRLSFIIAGIAMATLLPAQNYTFKGNVMEMLRDRLEGTMLYITNANSGRKIDSTKVVGGAFEFRGKVEGGDSVCYVAFGANRRHFILQPGDIVYDDQRGTFSGTPLNDILRQYEEERTPIFKDINEKYQALMANTSLSDEEKGNEGRKLTQEFNRRNDEVAMKYIQANQDNPLNALLIEQWLQRGDDVKKFDKAMSLAGDYAKNYGPLTREIPRMEAIRKVMEGMPFVDFTVPKGNLDGTDAKFSDYVGRGKWVLVDFWASWCGPCRGEIPNLKAAYEKYHDQGVDLLSVACWDKEEKTREALAEENMPWPQIINALDIATKAYGIIGIPQIILFAPDGRIAAKNLRGTEVAATIQRMLKGKAVITGEAGNVEDGSEVLLYENGNFMEKEHNQVIARGVAQNGRYRIEYDCLDKVRVGFVSNNTGNGTVIIEPGNITLDLMADQQKRVFASGTPLNDRLARFEFLTDSISSLMSKATENLQQEDYNTSLKMAAE